MTIPAPKNTTTKEEMRIIILILGSPRNTITTIPALAMTNPANMRDITRRKIIIKTTIMIPLKITNPAIMIPQSLHTTPLNMSPQS